VVAAPPARTTVPPIEKLPPAEKPSPFEKPPPVLPREIPSVFPPEKNARSTSPVVPGAIGTLFGEAPPAPLPPALPLLPRLEELTVLSAAVARCTRCPRLVKNRKQTVFGVGNPQPRLCFFGEAPGEDEDQQGEPFVGKAGQLLNKMLEACRLERSEVYILNVLKCRPPNNDTPSGTEVENCRPYFERQFELLQPEYICCLGTVAAQALLKTTTSIGRLRGKFYDYRGMRVLCTYHPSYLLRTPSAKKMAYEDLKLLMKELKGLDLDAIHAKKPPGE